MTTTSIIDKYKTESNSNIITRLKNKPVMLYDRDWEDIKLLLNLADHNCIIRLSESHPDLTADDIKYCCLFKLKFSITDIAIMMNVQSSTVSKRKLRIKNHLNPNELKNQLLEDYLYLF